MVERLARLAVAAPEPLGERSGNRRDRRRARQRPDGARAARAWRPMPRSAPNFAPRRGAASGAKPARIGSDPWPGPAPVSRSSLSTASIRAWASRAGASPRAMPSSRSVRLANTGSGMPGRASRSSERSRFRHLRALCTPLWRSGGVARAPWRELELGESDTPQGLAHRRSPDRDDSSSEPPQPQAAARKPMILGRAGRGQAPSRGVSPVEVCG